MTTLVAKDATKPEVVKELRSFSTTLTDGKGGRYRVHGGRRKDGSWVVSVSVVELDPKTHKVQAPSTRGATETFPDVTAARAYGDKAVAAGLKAGWVQSRGGGYSPRPDAFSLKNVPAPKGRK